MRRIAVINQKGGVGKTTTSVNLAAALAEQGRRVVVVDLDPQANLTLHLGVEPDPGRPSSYTVLGGSTSFAEALQPTGEPNLRVLPSNIDLSGAELELASAIGRDRLLSDAIEAWVEGSDDPNGPADYMIFDCPPSLGLLAVNALAAAGEVMITVQTEFLALMGMSKLVEIVQLIQRRLNPALEITGIAACLYDSRLRLAREVLGEIRKYFPGQVFRTPVRSNVKLAEAPSFGASIVAYAPESNGARDYRKLALEVIEQESRHAELAHLPAPRPLADLPLVVRSAEAETGGPFTTNRGGARVDVDRAPAPREGADAPAPEAPPAAPDEPEVTLQPAPRAEAPAEPTDRTRSARSDAVEEELRVMRAQDLPPLPPEAFRVDH
jgi:chromosome partitioning protein